MALRRQSLSPTAHLLRNSRLFSLPNPLPRPNVGETNGAGVTKASESATLPYPTHQAIATTKSSLARGDWGLKRNLPARSRLLQTSDPVLRVTQLDTIEHVTDFDSAADHVRTRQKWEEMGVPMMKGMAHLRAYDLSGTPPSGAFEHRDDTTSYDTALGLDENGLYLQALKHNKAARERRSASSSSSSTTTTTPPFTPFKPPPVDPDVHNARRWKHDGPWLPGQSADEFTAYLSREIGKRQAEFDAYLTEFVKNEIYTTRQLAASRSGDLAPIDPADAHAWQAAREKEWAAISDADIAAGINALRKETANNPLGSKLVTKLIMPFLRLPPIRFKYKSYSDDVSIRDFEMYQFDHDTSPLSTHPSAGLGYLRTKSYLATHPILGPQGSAPPVPARVIQPRQTGTTKETYARFGVAGFVANDQFRATDTNSASRANMNSVRDVETIDIDTPGGKKVLVNPQFGTVTNDGRIHIKLTRSTGPEIAVARGELDDRPPVREGADRQTPANASAFPPGVFTGFARKNQRSGVKELDEMSAKGQQFTEFLKSPARAQPTPGFPGLADALSPDE
ncbi:uncharacterized protein EKO05_0010917 [Ascochyta rabiei]|uniref:Uncharacterized protein n=1 Tax=Didymella rabiei TaxID=5454 RepID=A0A162ZIW0_DIDRA|nr:uncharacterized protein EKO05_0010917 [Ascochyta rabiei]KZM20625.1 hypothetical protein ST47_g8244 [Ascochyta rabiei]UPX20692.1 hypothetical protein EKO05_0010917 [Ascochyta rabiei]